MDADLSWSVDDPAAIADRLRSLEAELSGHLERAAEDIVLKIEADAARNAPVDTGRLRASIDSMVERVSQDMIRGVVGSNVDYALAQEIEQPYVRPAIESNRGFILERIEAALESAWEASG